MVGDQAIDVEHLRRADVDRVRRVINVDDVPRTPIFAGNTQVQTTTLADGDGKRALMTTHVTAGGDIDDGAGFLP